VRRGSSISRAAESRSTPTRRLRLVQLMVRGGCEGARRTKNRRFDPERGRIILDASRGRLVRARALERLQRLADGGRTRALGAARGFGHRESAMRLTERDSGRTRARGSAEQEQTDRRDEQARQTTGMTCATRVHALFTFADLTSESSKLFAMASKGMHS